MGTAWIDIPQTFFPRVARTHITHVNSRRRVRASGYHRQHPPLPSRSRLPLDLPATYPSVVTSGGTLAIPNRPDVYAFLRMPFSPEFPGECPPACVQWLQLCRRTVSLSRRPRALLLSRPHCKGSRAPAWRLALRALAALWGGRHRATPAAALRRAPPMLPSTQADHLVAHLPTAP